MAERLKEKKVFRPLLWASAIMILLLAGFFAALPHPLHRAEAFSSTGCEGDCSKCHSLTAQDVKAILQKWGKPGAEVLGTQMSPVKGLWEVSIEDQGNRSLFYVDFSKTYVLPGPIFEITSKANKTQEHLTRLQESRRIEFSRVSLDKALVMGNGKAPIKAAVFTDPDCPYCATLHHELEKVVSKRKDVAFYIILYPLQIHKDAYWKSKSILCSRSLKMLGQAFSHKEIARPECDTNAIDDNIKLAQNLGISGTPTIIFPDGRVHSGTLTAKEVEEFLTGKTPQL